MEDSHRWALQINRKNLVRDLRTEEIQDHIISSGIMDADDFEKIGLGKCRIERAGAFLDLLLNRGPLGFKHFCDSLQEKQKFLSKILKEDAEMLAKKKGRGAKLEVDALTLQNILRDNDDLKQTKAELQKQSVYNEELQRKIDNLLTKLTRERKRSEELTREGEDVKMKQGENIKHIHTLLQVVSEKNSQQNEGERDVKGLEAELYSMEERLNIKEETIKRIKVEKRKVDSYIIQERRMVNNLRGQLDALQKDMKLMGKDMKRMDQDMMRVKRERNTARQAADSRGNTIRKLQAELTITNQLKKNCESAIRYLNQSRHHQSKQAEADLSDLLKQYIQLKQTVYE